MKEDLACQVYVSGKCFKAFPKDSAHNTAYVNFGGGGGGYVRVAPVLNYTTRWFLSKPTSGIGPDNWMPCCSNFGYFVYNPIIETL